MMSWYNNFSDKPNIEINNIDKYIDILKKNNLSSNEDIIQNKLNELETEYDNNLVNLNNLCNNNDYFDKIKNENSLVILQKELDIIKLLTKWYFRNMQFKTRNFNNL